MEEADLLYLLLPYAAINVWALRKYMHRSAVTLWLLVGSMVFLWATFYAAFYSNLFAPGPEEAFASVDEVMETGMASLFWKDTWNRHGTLVVLIYFGLCYGVAWVMRKRPASQGAHNEHAAD